MNTASVLRTRNATGDPDRRADASSRPPLAAEPRGYSLLELAGVMMIVGAVGAVTANVLMQHLRQGDQEAEAASMTAIGQAFAKTVRDLKVLPGTNDWVDLLAPELNAASGRIRANKNGRPRLLLYAPGSAIKPGVSALYQTASGFPNAVNGADRVLILSSLGPIFPTNVSPPSAAVFESLWNTGPGQRPSVWTATDLPDPNDLHMVKIDLGTLLHRVVINNVASTPIPVQISIEQNGTLLTIAKSNPSVHWQSSFLDATGLNLHGADGLIFSREFITSDRTFYYSDAGWGLPRGTGSPGLRSQIAALVSSFLSASFPNALNLQRPRAAVDELYRTLWAYMDWAQDAFPEGGNNKNLAPDAYVTRSTVARLNQGTLNLIGRGGGGH